jgi:hypothetical protein
MSPEQATAGEVDGRSDQYSLGVLFYEMLTGHPPFEADSPIQVALAHVSQPPPPLPPQFAFFQPVMDRLLAKLPDQRYPGPDHLRARAEGAGHRQRDAAAAAAGGSQPVVVGTAARAGFLRQPDQHRLAPRADPAAQRRGGAADRPEARAPGGHRWRAHATGAHQSAALAAAGRRGRGAGDRRRRWLAAAGWWCRAGQADRSGAAQPAGRPAVRGRPADRRAQAGHAGRRKRLRQAAGSAGARTRVA